MVAIAGSLITKIGNTKLVDYGIRNEKSDIRVHVCVNAQKVYVYPTMEGIAAIETGKYRLCDVKTRGIITAQGYLVPPSRIRRCMPINAKRFLDNHPINFSDSTSVKGSKAIDVVLEMLRIGHFPFFVSTEEITDEVLQVSGADIYVNARMKIQVKCDFNGGDPKRDGTWEERITGNLFLQIAECNPFMQV